MREKLSGRMDQKGWRTCSRNWSGIEGNVASVDMWHETTLICPGTNSSPLSGNRGEFGLGKLMLEWSSRDFDMEDAKSSKNTQEQIIRSKVSSKSSRGLRSHKSVDV